MKNWCKVHKQEIATGIGLGGLALLPSLLDAPYIFYIVNLILIYSVLVLGLDLVMGYTGQVSLGHAAFFGIGAYTTAIFSQDYGWSFWATLPVAGLLAAAFGIIVGLTAPRLHDEYLVMSTLAFGIIVFLVILNWRDVTRGPMGIPGIPPPVLVLPGLGTMVIQTGQSLLRLLVLFFGLILFLTRRIVHSAYGRALLAIREDEVAAEALGINLTWHKVSIFAVSAIYAGWAGSFFVVFLGVASPESYGFNTSLTILIMSIVGGMGSITGALVGVTVLTLFSEFTRDYPVYSMMAYGLLLTFMIIYFPRGLVGFLKDRWERIRYSRHPLRLEE